MDKSITDIITALIGSASVIIPSYLVYKRGKKKLNKSNKSNEIKAKVVDHLLGFFAFDEVKYNISKLFDVTQMDRFLILVAINGKAKFNHVSVVFEQHKDNKNKVHATARYYDLEIDKSYKEMLHRCEIESKVELVVDEMKPSMLKNIYAMEKVKYSQVRFMTRKSIDKDNNL